MKLNNKRTFLIGLAFFSICAFWQAYDFVIPLILKHRFSLGDDIAGFVMALDNILALFLLPLFGTLSDRCQSRLGKRMPFIVAGTVAASALMIALPFADLAGRLGVFIVLLGLLLIAMGTYRSPAVALMPDLTPKPLRSRANAIINLMGAIGGIYALLMINLLVTGEPAENPSYLPLFVSVAALMLLSVALLVITVRERKIAASLPPEPEEAAPAGTGEKLPRAMLRSLVLILLSVFFWFMGYNAVTSAFSKYYTQVWGAVSGAANCMMIATGGAVVMYVPVGIVSSRFGRKKVILAGVALLAICFAVGALVKEFHSAVYILFVLVGAAWAMINVNSFPMVVEISKAGDVGKYTGYYYTFSMAAQVLTPILSGQLLEKVGYYTLFPYAAAMVALSFVTMLFVRHGDSRPQTPASRLEAFDVEA